MQNRALCACTCTCNLPPLFLCNHSDLPNPWKSDTHPVSVPTFVEPVGPSTILPPTLLGIFKMFLTSALVATIIEQMNIYARQVLGDAAGRKWTDVTEDDMWALFGFMILIGINKLPHFHHYWSQDPYFHYHPVADRISQRSFLCHQPFPSFH